MCAQPDIVSHTNPNPTTKQHTLANSGLNMTPDTETRYAHSTNRRI